MRRPLTRRHLLQATTLATIPVSGCLDRGVGGQPDRIPLEVVNRSGQTQTVSVELSELDTDTILLSETVELPPDEKREFDVGPIDAQLRYNVRYELGDQAENYPVSGSGLRGVEVRIEEDGTVRISPTMS